MKNNPQILMIGDTSPGGMASVVKEYMENGLSEEATFLSSYKGGSTTDKLVYFGKFLTQYIDALIINPDIKIIHIHSSHRGSFVRKSIAAYIAKLFHKKVIFHLHGSNFNEFYESLPGPARRLVSIVLDRCDLIIALSKQWQSDIAKKCSNKNIKILYNPIKIKEINNKNDQIINVLFMGRIGKRKGAYDIIDAAKYIQNPNIRINLYGDGEVEQVKELVNKHDLGNIINIKGWISGNQIEVALKEADICILPSYNEGLPMFILEAMGHGLPVISTPIGGIPESVENGVNGFLITPGDYKDLAQKIEYLADNTDLRHKMGQESYKIAREKFDVNIILTKLRGIYSELID